MSSKLNLYAEFLLNIRQVTLYATLQNSRNDESNAYITSDKKSLTIMHDTERATITFPSGISGKATVNFPVARKKEVSLRLEVIEDDKPSQGPSLEVENDSPWPASCLGSETAIACKSCQSIVVKSRSRVWKDLPREDWAEMMDLWHCHKPTVKDSLGNMTSHKGYAATDKLKAQAGIGFVDTCHLVLPYNECNGIHEGERSQIECATCSALIGTHDLAFEGVRLYKWSLLIRRSCGFEWEQNLIQSFVCAQLLGLIERHAIRKFVAYSGDINTISNGILLWVFTPDLKYCASGVSGGRPRRAMKILYEVINNPQEILEKNGSSMEELSLPLPVLEELHKDLDRSNSIIPEPAQLLQNWRVGLLDRFGPTEVPLQSVNHTPTDPGLTS